MRVRPYEARDRAGLVELWSTTFPEDPARNDPARLIRTKERVQPWLLLVAVDDDDDVLGAVMAGFDGTRGWLHHLAVHPSARGRGLGRWLVAEAEAGLGQLGCPKVNVQVRAGNEDVLSFYRELGYEVEERVSLGKILG